MTMTSQGQTVLFALYAFHSPGEVILGTQTLFGTTIDQQLFLIKG
jgi:hypothetical protein